MDQKNRMPTPRLNHRPLPRSPIGLEDLHAAIAEVMLQVVDVTPRRGHSGAPDRVEQVTSGWNTFPIVQSCERPVPREESAVVFNADPSFVMLGCALRQLRCFTDSPRKVLRVIQSDANVCKK